MKPSLDASRITHSLWLGEGEQSIHIIDQTRLPYALETRSIRQLDDICHAIISMQVRGAPLIGITAAFGFAFALQDRQQVGAVDDEHVALVAARLLDTRPTAVNLHWAVAQVQQAVLAAPLPQRAAVAMDTAKRVRQEDRDMCNAIGEHGFAILKKLAQHKKGRLNVLTHCNAGWLATSEWGTALAPIYKAHQAGIDVHVWVDETRPRNQGYLTAWELRQAGVPHTLIVDNSGGHIMQHGLVDVCIVGSDRTTARGDVCNKIGTYLKALAAHDNHIPFYVALPSSTIDWSIEDGLREIPIEERNAEEVLRINGVTENGSVTSIHSVPHHTAVANHAFDVTPARFVTGLITEQGVFRPEELRKIKA